MDSNPDSPPAVGSTSQIPIFSRKATGLVREVSLLNMIVFNATSTNPLGLGLVFFVFTLILFPRSNPFVAIFIAGVLCIPVWITFALFTAAIPRIGGDYTINSRILPPWLALGGNLCAFIAGVSAAPFFGYFIATSGISPAFTVIGEVTNSATMIRWGTYFDANHHNVVFATMLVSLALVSLLSAVGTRAIMRVITVLILIATVGFVVDILILLFTSHSSFVSTVNSVGGHDAYQKAVNAGRSQGIYPDHGFSVKSTIGAVYYGLTLTVYCWWGTYLSAEFKGGGQRKRQLTSMAGTGIALVVMLLVSLAIFTHTVGYDFFVSALNGNFAAAGGAVGSAGYVYFAALVASSTLVVVALSIVFIGWFLPAVYINLAMPHRAFLVWAFDGLAPRRLSDVNERTHTPIPAIAITFVLAALTGAWLAYSTTFFQYLAINTLFTYPPLVLVGIAAVLVRWRRPDLYRGTPAEWRVGGVEMLPVAGVGCAAVGCAAIFTALYFHEALGLKHFHLTEIAPIVVFGIAAAWWLIAKSIRRGQGVDLSLSYKAIPPD